MRKLSHSSAQPRKTVRVPLYPRMLGAGLAVTLAASCDGGLLDFGTTTGDIPSPHVEWDNKLVHENNAVQDSGAEDVEQNAPPVREDAGVQDSGGRDASRKAQSVR